MRYSRYKAVWETQCRVQKDLCFKTKYIAPRVILDESNAQSIYPSLMSVLTPILVDNGDTVAVNGVPKATASSSATSVLNSHGEAISSNG